MIEAAPATRLERFALQPSPERSVAVVLIDGLSVRWNGSVDTNWSTAANWTPASVPTSSDGVFISAVPPNQPVLTANASVLDMVVESGASVDTAGFTLTAGGNVDAAGSIFGTGSVTLSGSGWKHARKTGPR